MEKKTKKEIISQKISDVIMNKAGVKDSYGIDCCSPSGKKNKELSYPRLYLDIKQAPDLKDYKVGDEVMLIISGTLTGHRKNDSEQRKSEEFDIKITKIGCPKK